MLFKMVISLHTNKHLEGVQPILNGSAEGPQLLIFAKEDQQNANDKTVISHRIAWKNTERGHEKKH